MKKTRMNPRVYKMVLSAIMIALSVVLSLVTIYKLPMGGEVTLFSMVPIITISWIFGPKWGLGAGLTLALVRMLMDSGTVFGYVSGAAAYTILVMVDYILPFTLLGLGGVFRKVIKNRYWAIGVGTFMVCFLRFVCHFISGVTIWNSFAAGTAKKVVYLYSLTYNGSYMLPETILTIIGMELLAAFVFPKLDENGMLKH